ncbi:MAG: pirin family protein [Deltaproteobacteria bacterium]|nr:pirin family protein [Deltaproteobacteria bacterium]
MTVSSAKSQKKIARIVAARPVLEGGGFLVHRPFPTPELMQVDPFLLLDEMGPVIYPPGGAKGAPDHPHRGFETVTYLLAGEMEHRDSAGHAGKLTPGDLQWMTAGAGVVHSEMPSEAFQKSGGKMHGFQLWVNLAAKDKMMAPRYQELSAQSVPVVDRPEEGAKVRILAGAFGGETAATQTTEPILYLDIELAAQGSFKVSVPIGQTCLVYLFEGKCHVGADGAEVRAHTLVLFEEAGDLIVAKAAAGPCRFLVLAARPLREPVARRGPFVMNTEAEIRQAFVDYQEGRFATIPPQVKRS